MSTKPKSAKRHNRTISPAQAEGFHSRRSCRPAALPQRRQRFVGDAVQFLRSSFWAVTAALGWGNSSCSAAIGPAASGSIASEICGF